MPALSKASFMRKTSFLSSSASKMGTWSNMVSGMCFVKGFHKFLMNVISHRVSRKTNLSDGLRQADRHRARALAGGMEKSIGYGRGDGDNGSFASACGGKVRAGQQMNLYVRHVLEARDLA